MNDGLLSIIDTDQGRDLLENTSNIFDIVKQNIKLKKKVEPLQFAKMSETLAIEII